MADARTWLRGRKADLILCDPPHLDTFQATERETAAALHLKFVSDWLPLALAIGCPVVHSVGSSTPELSNYMVVAPNPIARVWVHEGGHHIYLFHNLGRDLDIPSLCTDVKPDPWYPRLVTELSRRGDLVVDPFCGRGEIPSAAQHTGREWRGCDINAESVGACHGLGL